ncbi:hypothetical protein LUZ60_013173 [Juncus effusus]|nr:hypothetical protein LUZ60_013173 [Juncus effusus]
MAGLPDDFNEDDFEEYNPHPYLGGYDIVRTYGAPLPPSTETCYPISSSSVDSAPVASSPISSSSVDSAPVASSPVQKPDPPSQNLPVKESEPVVAPPPVIDQSRFEPHEYGEYNPEPYKPDLFRSWPFGSSDYYCCKGRRGEVRDRNYWNQLMKGLDFLFGHNQGFGERRVGTDIYGIPIYANKRNGTESVLVQVEQPSVHKLEYHEDLNENWSSKYEVTKEENRYMYNNEYNTDYYNYENNNSSYSDTYQDWGFKNEGSSYYAEESREENNFITNPIHSYNQHYYENPLHVQINPNESTWTQNSISYENNPSYYEKHEENHEKSYQSYETEPYRYESLEPFNPSWSQNLGYFHNNLEGEPIASDHYSPMYNSQGNESSQYEYNQNSSYYENNQTWSDNNHVNYGYDLSQKSDWVDHHSYKLSDSIFGTSHNYYAYDQ